MTSSPRSPAHAPHPQLGVPAYFGPWESTHWNELCRTNPALVVINPATGPGTRVHRGYRPLVRSLRKRGSVVLGYVPTDWFERPLGEQLEDADRYLAGYGTSGVLFDEIPVTSQTLRRCRSVVRELTSQYPDARTAFNPGRSVPSSWLKGLPSVLWITFEGAASSYLDRPVARSRPNEWHLVHSVASRQRSSVMRQLVAQSPAFAYVTADRLPNPWDVFDGDFVEPISSAHG